MRVVLNGSPAPHRSKTRHLLQPQQCCSRECRIKSAGWTLDGAIQTNLASTDLQQPTALNGKRRKVHLHSPCAMRLELLLIAVTSDARVHPHVSRSYLSLVQPRLHPSSRGASSGSAVAPRLSVQRSDGRKTRKTALSM